MCCLNFMVYKLSNFMCVFRTIHMDRHVLVVGVVGITPTAHYIGAKGMRVYITAVIITGGMVFR